MQHKPLVSIVIKNYNYDSFLGEAIDSALGQTYPHKEVVVVDDGSTDSSREVIAAYGDQIVPVLQENRGYAAAMNAGFAASRGQLILWLDSDDVFAPNKAERVVDAFCSRPGAAVIYHRLQNIDAAGRPLFEPHPRDLWVGSIKDRVQRSGGWWPRPPTSALAFPRTFLARIHPMPELTPSGVATRPDGYAGGLAPFFGEVVGLPDVLAKYRKHGQNVSLGYSMQDRIKLQESEHQQLSEGLHQLGRDDSRLNLRQNLWYLEALYNMRGVSLAEFVISIMSCPLLSPKSRLRAASKAVLRHRERGRVCAL